MAPLKKHAWGWLCLFQIFSANYGFHLSSPQGTSSPETDYAGVSEAAGLQSLRSVTFLLIGLLLCCLCAECSTEDCRRLVLSYAGAREIFAHRRDSSRLYEPSIASFATAKLRRHFQNMRFCATILLVCQERLDTLQLE